MSDTIHSNNSLFVNLPSAVVDAVLQDASQRLGLLVSDLRITQAEEQPRSDDCLGIVRASEYCAGALVPGYEVTVEGGQKLLVYRTMHVVPTLDCLLS